MKPAKTKRVNIRSKEEPKFAMIRDCWDEDTDSVIIELLHEYQELFPTKFSELKGILGDLGVMRIPFKPKVTLVK